MEFIWGLEPSRGVCKKTQKNLQATDIRVDWLNRPGEEIPLDDDSTDTVVLVYTLCTIPDWARALEQMRRVLKPGGKLIFCEHGLAPDPRPRKWQQHLNPIWKRIAHYVSEKQLAWAAGPGFILIGLRTLYQA